MRMQFPDNVIHHLLPLEPNLYISKAKPDLILWYKDESSHFIYLQYLV